MAASQEAAGEPLSWPWPYLHALPARPGRPLEQPGDPATPAARRRPGSRWTLPGAGRGLLHVFRPDLALEQPRRSPAGRAGAGWRRRWPASQEAAGPYRAQAADHPARVPARPGRAQTCCSGWAELVPEVALADASRKPLQLYRKPWPAARVPARPGGRLLHNWPDRRPSWAAGGGAGLLIEEAAGIRRKSAAPAWTRSARPGQAEQPVGRAGRAGPACGRAGRGPGSHHHLSGAGRQVARCLHQELEQSLGAVAWLKAGEDLSDASPRDRSRDNGPLSGLPADER